MNNSEFLDKLVNSFIVCMQTSPRSNEKLKILHGAIASDLANILGNNFTIQSLGYGAGKEGNIRGRYIDKVVDITVSSKSGILAGIGVKFVMSNYSQNSNNYFENMLGETANIRCGKVPYFQVLVLPEKLPYFKSNGEIEKWEEITLHNLSKYVTLSKDDENIYLHTPIKTLLYLIKIPEYGMSSLQRKEDLTGHFIRSRAGISFVLSNLLNDSELGRTVILNDYETFRDKFINYVKSI